MKNLITTFIFIILSSITAQSQWDADAPTVDIVKVASNYVLTINPTFNGSPIDLKDLRSARQQCVYDIAALTNLCIAFDEEDLNSKQAWGYYPHTGTYKVYVNTNLTYNCKTPQKNYSINHLLKIHLIIQPSLNVLFRPLL